MWRKALIVSLVLLQPGAAAAQQAISGELIKLHDDLRLTPDQDAAWRTYTLAIAPSPQMQARHRAAAELLPLEPTPRRIALLQASMAADEAEFRRQGAAVIAFYDQLTPDQQRTFDRDTLPTPTPAPAAPPPTAQSGPPRR